MRVSGANQIRDAYDGFSAFYRELIESTGRTSAEKKLLARLVRRLGISRDSSILDAACGTGEALAHLRERGFTNLYGVDASRGMLVRAKELNPKIPFRRSDWEKLRVNSFGVRRHFDLVYLISLSLPHAQNSALCRILRRFRSLLRTGGQLVFDVRDWRLSPRGLLREPDRPRGRSRSLGTIAVMGREWTVTDRCLYNIDRQIVEYTVTATGAPGDRQRFKVSYALLSAGDFTSMLAAAGFCRITQIRYGFWPYTILVAEAGEE